MAATGSATRSADLTTPRVRTRSSATIAVYLESGAKRTFACAVEWPGWCRSGSDEASALAALLGSAPRYARAVGQAGLELAPPTDTTAFHVVARERGDATTDFGAPASTPAADARPMDGDDLRRTGAILRGCWRAFDAAVANARGKRLAKGPRGGGRTLDAIVSHVVGAEEGYLSALGWKAPKPATKERVRAAVLEGMAASARGDIPARGPRGGKRWKPRHFARRLAWHALDHAWEIEDRAARAAAE